MADDTHAVITWREWPMIERLFDFFSLNYKLHKDFPIEHINRAKSRTNHARLDNTAMAGWRNKDDDEIVLMDGNYRHEILMALGHTKCWIYIVTGIKPHTCDEVTRMINMYVGQGATDDDSLRHAVHVVNTRARAEGEAPNKDLIAAVARLFLLKPARVARKLKVESFRARLIEGGDLFVAGGSNLPDRYLDAVIGAGDDAASRELVAGLMLLSKWPDVDVIRQSANHVKSAGVGEERRQEAERQADGWKAAEAATAGRTPIARTKKNAAKLILADMKRLTRTLTHHVTEKRKSAKDVFTTPEQSGGFTAASRALRAQLSKMEEELGEAAPATIDENGK